MPTREAEPGAMPATFLAPFFRAVRRARFAGRRLGRDQRALPDFLVLGAQKSGTTSLYYQLVRHPRILPCFTKEVHYFTLHPGRDRSWYRAHFPRRQELARRGAVCGEATPYYLFEPRVAAQVARVLPDARFVAVLRNPADRAYSHYQHARARGHETLAFDEALERETERLAPELERMAREPGYVSLVHQRFSYFSRGLYAEQLARWLGHFPRERFLVLPAERYYADPDAVCGRVFDFLGLPPARLPSLSVPNRREYAPPDADLRADLERRYTPHNRELADLLGEDFGWG